MTTTTEVRVRLISYSEAQKCREPLPAASAHAKTTDMGSEHPLEALQQHSNTVIGIAQCMHHTDRWFILT